MIEIQNLGVKEICESPMNPRKRFEKADIEELAKNIAEQGLLQPITVRTPRAMGFDTFEKLDKDGKAHEFKYEVVCGARRFRAVNHLGWKEVPAIVREMTDAEAFDAMITENLQRKDVDPIDEAVAFSELMRKGQSVKELAARFGKSERYIQDRTKLCGLIKELQKELTKGHIPLIGAIYLAKCDEDTQRKFYEEEIDGCNDEDDGDCYPFYDIKEYVKRAFKRLAGKDWMKGDEDEGWNDETEVPKCKTCEFNTANHGCLFHEMKGDAECTRESCFNKKELVYRKWKLGQMKLMKKGEEYAPDMTIAIEAMPESWRGDGYKEEMQKANEYMKDAFPDVCVMHESDFGTKCWYSEDDERLQKMLAKGDVVRTVTLFREWYAHDVDFYYKKGLNGDACNRRGGGDVMESELETARVNNRGRMNEEMANAFKEIDMGDLKGHEDVVRMAVGLILFSQVGYMEVNDLGVGYDGKKMLEYLRGGEKNYVEVLKLTFKEFCRRNNSCNNVARTLLMKEFAPDVYAAVEKTFDDKLEKMEARIRAKYADKK